MIKMFHLVQGKTRLAFILVGLSHFLMVLRDLLLAHQFGNGMALDAFLITMIIPNFFISVFSGSMTSSFLPKVVQKITNSPEELRPQLSSALATFVATSLLLCLVLAATGPLWHTLMIARLGEEQKLFAQTLLFPGLGLALIQVSPVFFRMVFAAQRRSAIATLGPVLNTAITVTGLLLIRPTEISSYVNLLYVSYGCELVVLFAVFLFSVGLQFHLEALRNSFQELFDRHFWYPATSSLLMATTMMLDQSMASWLLHGGVVALGYGLKMSSSVLGVFSGFMGNTIFPELAELASQKRWSALAKQVRTYSRSAFVAGAAVAGLLALLSYDIVKLLFEHGAFKAEDTLLVSRINICYLIQVPFYLMNQVGIQSLYSLQKGHQVTKCALANVFLNATGNYILAGYFGLAGISLSTSLVQIFVSLTIFTLLRRELQHLTQGSLQYGRAS